MQASEVQQYSQAVPEILVRVSPDQLKAFLTLRPVIDREYPYTVEDILQNIHDAGVDVGILADEIAAVVASQEYPEEKLIARGEDAVNGEDTRIEYFFNPSPTAAPLDDEERVDWREISQIQNVSKGQLLARKNPATSGKNGVTVKGRTVLARSGLDWPLFAGKGAEFSPDNPLEVVARLNGCVRLDKREGRGQIVVDNIYEVKGDVNYGSGNVKFDGSVRVKGDILPGFRVQATGDVQVGGCVDRAQAEAGGSVLVVAGILGGPGKTEVKAQGNVSARFASNATVEAGADILIRDEAINCHLDAQGSVVIGGRLGGRGAIIGGRVVARKTIEARQVGSESATTHLELMTSDNVQDTYEQTVQRVADLREALRQVEDKIVTLSKSAGKGQPGNVAGMIQKMTELHSTIQQQLAEAEPEEERLRRILQDDKEPEVVVYGSLNSGTEITIDRQSRTFAEGYQSVRVVLSPDQHSVIAIQLRKP